MVRVKSGMLVAAALRYASQEFIDCVLVRRGDADAGAIFIHINVGLDQHKILSRILDFEGVYNWQAITGADWVDAETAKDFGVIDEILTKRPIPSEEDKEIFQE